MNTELTPLQLVKGIIEHEESFESRLDLLTSIGTSTTNTELFRACEEIRDELVSSSEGKQSTDDVSGSGVLRNGRKSGRSKRDNQGSNDKKSGRKT